MHYKIVLRTLGQIMLVEAGLLVLPFLVSLGYKEREVYHAFLIPIAILFCLGYFLVKKFKLKDKSLFSKEGFLIVSISWIIMSLFGALPFIISGQIPNFFDAFFETVSGFSTTGASILTDVESLSKGLLFWRSFTHWIGGMGILVFVLAFVPHLDTRSMYILKAESPGPQVGKLVSRVKFTAQILYIIYAVLTLILILMLWAGDMPLFDSVLNAFATAGTGGFSIKNAGIMAYNSPYAEVVITVFMIIFGTNFNIFYLILIGHVSQAIFSEELRWYLGIIIGAIVIITIDTLDIFGKIGVALRHSSFQVASIISTTGFASFDFNTWPSLSKWVLVLLMFSGACAGSTCGGMKISRVAMLFKSIIVEIKNSIHPRQVTTITFEKRPVDSVTLRGVHAFLSVYFFIILIGTLIVNIGGHDLITSFTSIVSCLNNVGPGLGAIGPMGNYSIFSNFTKFFLSFVMLAGRLEIFPMLVLFYPKFWRSI